MAITSPARSAAGKPPLPGSQNHYQQRSGAQKSRAGRRAEAPPLPAPPPLVPQMVPLAAGTELIEAQAPGRRLGPASPKHSPSAPASAPGRSRRAHASLALAATRNADSPKNDRVPNHYVVLGWSPADSGWRILLQPSRKQTGGPQFGTRSCRQPPRGPPGPPPAPPCAPAAAPGPRRPGRVTS